MIWWLILPNINSLIGDNCEILSSTTIVDSKIANNVRVEASVIEEAEVADNATIRMYQIRLEYTVRVRSINN